MVSSSDKLKSVDLEHPILLFDGVCNLCDGLVQFIIKRDPKGTFRFASLQSPLGQNLAKEAGLDPQELGTAILYYQGKFQFKSDMALGVASQLGGLWPILGVFKIVPAFFRNGIYNWVAKNRYRWFGKKEQCMIPSPDLKSRFLDN